MQTSFYITKLDDIGNLKISKFLNIFVCGHCHNRKIIMIKKFINY